MGNCREGIAATSFYLYFINRDHEGQRDAVHTNSRSEAGFGSRQWDPSVSFKPGAPREKGPGAEGPRGGYLRYTATAALARRHSWTTPGVARGSELVESVPALREVKAEPGGSQLDWPSRPNTSSKTTFLGQPSQG